jgi:ATP-binding cassette subfamily B protein
MDEATSALDAVSERMIEDALRRNRSGRTSILVSHRLSTVMLADRAFVLSDGKIVEDGEPQALLKHDGYFRALFHDQLFSSHRQNAAGSGMVYSLKIPA